MKCLIMNKENKMERKVRKYDGRRKKRELLFRYKAYTLFSIVEKRSGEAVELKGWIYKTYILCIDVKKFIINKSLFFLVCDTRYIRKSLNKL